MSSLALVPSATPRLQVDAATRQASAGRGHRRKFLVALCLVIGLSPGLLTLPPVWQGALRTLLTWQAARGGYELTVASISGGVFGATSLEGIRLRPRQTGGPASSDGTDVTIESARFTLAWRFPAPHATTPWAKEVRLEGVRGLLDLAPGAISGRTLPSWANDTAARWLPTDFVVQADDFQVRQGSYHVRVAGFFLSGQCDGAGEIVAREVRAEGPGFTTVFPAWHGQTFWKAGRLTVSGLDLGNGISLASGTLDASEWGHRRLAWEGSLAASGGEVRGQGSIDCTQKRVALEVAVTLHRVAFGPLARMLGLRGEIAGQVEQAGFTFHGNPRNLADAQMGVSVQATGFQWGDRRWASLDAQAVVVNRRVQLHRFELRQDGDRLSISGECPLPPDDGSSLTWTGEASWWKTAGFSWNVDTRLDDSHALAESAGPGSTDRLETRGLNPGDRNRIPPSRNARSDGNWPFPSATRR